MEKKKPIILSVIALLALVALVVGATFAYFQAQVGEGKSADIVVKSYTVDTFTFATDSQISLNLDQDNFASGKGNITGSTYASATLTANNKTNTATEHYYLYLNIENNTFTYSINESTPEIIMTVTDSSGTEVTDISTLNHVIVTGANGAQVSGYDITNKKGLITLFNNREITTTSSKEERWNIKVTFVNYDASQNANAGKSMSAKVMIQKEVMPFHQTCNDNTLACHTAKLYSGTQGENGIYYHDANLANGAGDNSYRFAGASDAVNNYLCFGNTQSPCPADNLYRIIGVFGDRVKLIKSDYATSALLGTDGDYKEAYTATGYVSSNYKGNNLASIAGYVWNKSQQNTWSLSNLNKTNLNQNFITKIGAAWANKIDMTTWKVGGNTNIADQPAKTAYQDEIVNPLTAGSTDNKTEYSAKIGLMYASDYGFAAAPSAWTADLSTYNDEAIKNANWMYMGLYEWTISRQPNQHRNGAFFVTGSGFVTDSYGLMYAYGVRPVFNLTSSVNYASGSGSATDPILVN